MEAIGGNWRIAMGEVWITGGKALEIMLTLENPRGIFESFEVNSEVPLKNIPGQKGRADAATEDAVFVSFGHCGVSRVEPRGRMPGFHDANRRGQVAIELAQEIFRRDWRLQWKTRHLGQGMNTGVSAAGALRQRVFANNSAQRRLQFTLNR